MVFQYRPVDAGDLTNDTMYSPSRDIARLGPLWVRMAIESLSNTGMWEPWLEKFIKEQKISDAQLVDAAVKLVNGFNTLNSTTTAKEALTESGFYGVNPVIQMIFYTRMGQQLVTAIWAGVQDLNSKGDPPPKTLRDMWEVTQEQYKDFIGEESKKE